MAKSRKSGKTNNTGAQGDDTKDTKDAQRGSGDAEALKTDGAEELLAEAVSSEQIASGEEGKTSEQPVEDVAEPADAGTTDVTEDPPETDTKDAGTEEAGADDAAGSDVTEPTGDVDAEQSGTEEMAEPSDTGEETDQTDAGTVDPADDPAFADAEVAGSEHDAEPADSGTVEVDEEKKDPKPEPKPEPQVVQGSMWPAVFGGVIAALVGFIAGRGDVLDQYLPASMQRGSVDMAAVEEMVSARTSELQAMLAASTATSEAQAARLDALEAAGDTGLSDQVTALQTEVETIASQIAGLEGQPAVPADPGVNPEEVAALQDAIAAQEAQLAALSERADAAEANAETEAARILASAALLSVVTAMDSGEPFSGALGELEAVTPVEVPADLSAAAETGVPTMAELQDTFPDAARAALRAARSGIPEGESATLTAFFQRQLNVRSVAPREGDDADAVLSRAEAAVRSGDITLALTELEALPEAASGAMNEWIEAAAARKAAKDAANALADGLSSN